jgi:hypothetical protein
VLSFGEEAQAAPHADSEPFRSGKGLVGHAVASWLCGAVQSLS